MMCTVTVVADRDLTRIVCNRDEQRSRAVAAPPRVHRMTGGHAMWPVDPVSGGTWIGVNDSGLAAVLLNRTPPTGAATRTPRSSRGTLVPRVMRHRTLADALDELQYLRPADYQPFELVMLQATQCARSTWGAAAITVIRSRLSHPFLFTSSGLGDAVVLPARRSLFASLVVGSGDPLAGQRAYHAHVWPDRPEISVLMARHDAATVSRTTIDLTARRAALRYLPL